MRSGFDVRITAATRLHCVSLAGLSYALSMYPEFHASLKRRLSQHLAFDLCPVAVIPRDPRPDPIAGTRVLPCPGHLSRSRPQGLVPFVSMDGGRVSETSQERPAITTKLESSERCTSPQPDVSDVSSFPQCRWRWG